MATLVIVSPSVPVFTVPVIVSVALEPAVRSNPVHRFVPVLYVPADAVNASTVILLVGSGSDIVIPVRAALPLFFTVRVYLNVCSVSTCPSESLIILVMMSNGDDTVVDTLPLAGGAVGDELT